jgi:hypothetical protein
MSQEDGKRQDSKSISKQGVKMGTKALKQASRRRGMSKVKT